MSRIEAVVSPLKANLPERFFPYFLGIFRVLVEVLFPLALLAIYTVIKMQIVYHGPLVCTYRSADRAMDGRRIWHRSAS